MGEEVQQAGLRRPVPQLVRGGVESRCEQGAYAALLGGEVAPQGAGRDAHRLRDLVPRGAGDALGDEQADGLSGDVQAESLLASFAQ
jgi:hypothetical protein